MATDSNASTQLSGSSPSDAPAPPFYWLDSDPVGQVELGPLLGEGQGAQVFAAQIDQNRSVAIKVARHGFEGVLLREARALCLASGPGLVGVHGVYRSSSGAVCLVLELLEGGNLESHLLAQSLGPSRRELLAAALLAQLTPVLSRLHRMGWAHGDLKPQNVICGEGQLFSLIDLGMAHDGATVEGGTPHYLPREVLQGEATSPQKADTYALAMILAEVLAPAFRDLPPDQKLVDELPCQWRVLLSSVLLAEPCLRPTLRSFVEHAQLLDLLEPEKGHGRSVIRTEYLCTRLDELEGGEVSLAEGFDGAPGSWCRELSIQLESISRLQHETSSSRDLNDLKGADPDPKSLLGPLSSHDRKRFLVRLMGPHAASFQLPDVTDQSLIGALEALAEVMDLRALLFSDLLGAVDSGGAVQTVRLCRSGEKTDWFKVALSLGRRPVPRELLVLVAKAEVAPEPLLFQAADVARQMGELPLARKLLARCPESEKKDVESAQLLLREGGKPRDELQLMLETCSDDRICGRAASILARMEIDESRPDTAISLLAGQKGLPAVCEVRALSFLMQGNFARAEAEIARGDALCESDEESARMQGLLGMLEHAAGTPLAALESFKRASESAARAGAALEEATYRTGMAASASDAGLLSQALDASERAECLFEALGKESQMARALLARASVLLAVGALSEVAQVVRRGLAHARRSGDRLAEAYFFLCRADSLPLAEKKEQAAHRAQEILAEFSTEDQLRAATRVLEATSVVHEKGDEWAGDVGQIETRLDWWRARATVLEKATALPRSQEGLASGVVFASSKKVVDELVELASSSPFVSALGPALVAGAHLSLRAGMAEEARLLLSRGGEVAAHFLQNVPSDYRLAAQELLWIQQVRGRRISDEAGGAQLSDVEGLLRALGQRQGQGFTALLDQVLDMLLFWTGVQRGLLLLRAPGGKLVVRAGRNLDRRDLSEEQRSLSYSMAHRALEEGRAVVAVDAMQDVSKIHRSVHALNLRSVVAVPLTARGEVLGVAYLDDKVRRGAFGEKELSWVNLIGTVAALAISDERDRLELQRALRRARRAEGKLAVQLMSREEELEVAERALSRFKVDGKLRGDYSGIVGRSPAMKKLLSMVDRVAHSDVPALILGESGTGKELVARAIAQSGQRKGAPFVAENCGAVPEGLLESTLFGHVKGAFTGATKDQAGLFVLAHGGTLFLDEIGEMSLVMQSKLLRVLQESEVRPLGAPRTRPVNVRLIVATHRDLKKMVEEGRFREDLYYRLNVVSLQVPPLRDRPSDIPALTAHFVEKYRGEEKRLVSQSTIQRLMAHPWPGNVRQLENEIRRMLVLGGPELGLADLSAEFSNLGDTGTIPMTLREKVDALERRLVIEAFEAAGGNRTRAAEALGLSRFGLQKMSQRLKVEVPKSATKSGPSRDRGLDDT